jgi:hypothetical protein
VAAIVVRSYCKPLGEICHNEIFVLMVRKERLLRYECPSIHITKPVVAGSETSWPRGSRSSSKIGIMADLKGCLSILAA